MEEEDRVVNLVGCARCEGEGHKQIKFVKLTHPIEVNGEEYAYWAPCPTNGEPIIMAIVDDAKLRR